MLNPESPLKRIPLNVNPKQALFIDGIRHAIEIINVAYSRLQITLTFIATNPPAGDQLREIYPIAFLDAWAMVDAIDRFRMLYQKMPGIKFDTPIPETPTLKDVTQPFRDIRNIADHLAQRADFLISKDSAALGTLTWMTGFEVKPVRAWYCTLHPGTIRIEPEPTLAQIETKLEWPTGRITLSAGGYTANLSDVLPHIHSRVTHFEDQLSRVFSRPEFSGAPIANDSFTRRCFEIAPGQFPEIDGLEL